MTMIRPRSDVVYGICRGLPSESNSKVVMESVECCYGISRGLLRNQSRIVRIARNQSRIVKESVEDCHAISRGFLQNQSKVVMESVECCHGISRGLLRNQSRFVTGQMDVTPVQPRKSFLLKKKEGTYHGHWFFLV